MNVLIKGMEMPDNCYECPLEGSRGVCLATNREDARVESLDSPEWCPLEVAEPVKHGKWIYIRGDENIGLGLYECSECHKGDIHAKEREVPYCWNCGARMDGGENEL